MARILVATLTLVLAAAAIAVAAPDRTQVLTAAAPTFGWDGSVAAFSLAPFPSAETCTKPAPGRFCDETLLEIKDAGTLEVVIDEWNADSDLDLFLITSDAEGTFGEEVTNSLNSGPGPEKVSAKVQPGFYLVFVNYFQAVNTGYKGKATLKATPAAVPAPGDPTPAPTTTPPPASDDRLPESGQLAVDVEPAGTRIRAASARVGCTVVCKASLRLVVNARTARKLKLGRKATVIAKGAATIDRKQAPPVALKLTSRARKRLKKARSVKATIKASVTDSSGGQRTAETVRVKLKR